MSSISPRNVSTHLLVALNALDARQFDSNLPFDLILLKGAKLDAVPTIRPILALFEGVATGAADGFGRMA